ncbi:MAG: 50S ribosomal protein L29 [Alphaproteobacteria bacterium]
MKFLDLKSKNTEELNSIYKDLKKEAFNLRFQKVYGQLQNPSRIRTVRRSIAKILTLLNANNNI